MDLTFLIPVKLETQDRVRNLTTVITYLASNYDAKIIVKECDTEPRFESLVGTQFTDMINYSFEKQTQPFFHKTKLLNDMIEMATTEVVANYDTDVVLPISSVNKAYEMIKSGQSDAVYPYGCGVYQKAVTYPQEVFEEFLGSMDIDVLDRNSTITNSTIGWTQFIRRSNYIDSFMMNEEFAAWGPEDCELHYRLNALGNKVDRINDYIYHLDHARSTDSWFSNPKWQGNNDLWNMIRQLPKEKLISYYSTLEYVKRRKDARI